jgi:hypothetical protein
MLGPQRKEYLLKILAETGQVIAKAVSKDLGLSEDTIRRDLGELASEGRLQRVHGGALPSSPAVVDFAGHQQLASEAKVDIGRAAAKMVRRGQIVILDGGTTTLQLAKHLPLDLKATVVTHSPTIAVALVQHPVSGGGAHRRPPLRTLGSSGRFSSRGGHLPNPPGCVLHGSHGHSSASWLEHQRPGRSAIGIQCPPGTAAAQSHGPAHSRPESGREYAIATVVALTVKNQKV